MNSRAGHHIALLWEDLRFGLRMLRKSPLLNMAAVATLALGIGVTSAVFTVINAVILRPLPYPEPQRLVVLWGTDKRPPSPDLPALANNARNRMMIRSDVAERWRESSQAFDSIAWYRGWSFNASVGADPVRVRAGLVSAEFFACLQVAPLLGRGFVASEVEPGKDQVAVLGYAFWQSRFAADPQVIGQTIQLDGVPHTIIGVMPKAFRMILPFIHPEVDLWAPISREYTDKRRWSIVTGVGRLKPDLTEPQAQAEMSAISERLEAEGRKFQGHGVNVARLDSEVVSDSQQGLWIAFAAVGCVLLIACANLAGLRLAHTAQREKEIGIRLALGATRGRILRQLLTECVLMSLIGGAAGLLLSAWLTHAFVALQPADIPRLEEVSVDRNVWLFGFAVSVVTGILFGLMPAIQFSRAAVIGALKQSTGQAWRGRFLLAPRRLLLVVEVALTAMLLIAMGLLLRSFILLKSVNPGFQSEGLLAMIVPLSETAYRTPQQQAEFARELLERARGIPMVEAAAVSNSLPMQNRFTLGMRLDIEGREMSEGAPVYVRAVSADYFSAMRIPLLRGRVLTSADAGKGDVVVINRQLAERLWPDLEPVGSRIRLDKAKPRTIVGVVDDVKSSSMDTPAEAEVYLPFDDQPASSIGLVLRSSGDLRPLAASVGAVVRGIDQNQPVTEVATMQEMIDDFFARPRFNFLLFAGFAALALILSVVGIYGVISHSVKRRTHEIGIRIALGAPRRTLLFLFIRDGLSIAIAGIALGLLGALATARLLASLLFGVPPLDQFTFVFVAAILLAVCLLATYLPARRAMKIDPMVALRHE